MPVPETGWLGLPDARAVVLWSRAVGGGPGTQAWGRGTQPGQQSEMAGTHNRH